MLRYPRSFVLGDHDDGFQVDHLFSDETAEGVVESVVVVVAAGAEVFDVDIGDGEGETEGAGEGGGLDSWEEDAGCVAAKSMNVSVIVFVAAAGYGVSKFFRG